MKINFYLILSIMLLHHMANAQQLKINEVMASNTATMMSDLGNYGDWVELYNTSNSDIDLAGLYFTDDIAAPTKYQFPSSGSNSIVPANGFKLIWADDSAQFLHANFKLSGSTGETIAIFASNGITLIDSVSFGIQTTDVSYGRTIDGGSIWTTFSISTPEATNGTTTLQNDLNKNLKITIFPNPTNGDISIVETSWDRANIFELNGKQIKSIINYSQTNRILNTNDLSSGAYFIQLFDQENTYYNHFIKY